VFGVFVLQKKGKLELTWVGKDDRVKLEPRVLVEDPSKSYGDLNAENMLIYGDNLLALKALEQDFGGAIKCIYVDPPFNTGQAFEHYDDNLEHSLWLTMMCERLKILHRLLRKDGVFFIHLDNIEVAYARVVLDELFLRRNFITQITWERSQRTVLGQGQTAINNTCEYILVYAKDATSCLLNKLSKEYPIEENTFRQYNKRLKTLGTKDLVEEFADRWGKPVKIFKHSQYEFANISLRAFEDRQEELMAFYVEHHDEIVRFSNQQAESTFQQHLISKMTKPVLYSIEYVPSRGKNRGKLTTIYYYRGDVVLFLKEYSVKRGGKIYKQDDLNNFWSRQEIPVTGIAGEGGVNMRRGKKPERLLERVLAIGSDSNDWVLDSFAGSGTTGAVAHKMGRRWIMVELGDHCHTHIIPRMKAVVDGSDQSGISKTVNWKGGGSFKYYRLAESLLVRDKELSTNNQPVYIINPRYDEKMMIKAICKIENFRYRNEGRLHGISSENRFLHVTTNLLTQTYLDSLAEDIGVDQSLLIYCTRRRTNLVVPDNIEIKKIPSDLLAKCDFEEDKE